MKKIKVELNETRIKVLEKLLPYFRISVIESDKSNYQRYNMSFSYIELEVLTNVIEELIK